MLTPEIEKERRERIKENKRRFEEIFGAEPPPPKAQPIVKRVKKAKVVPLDQDRRRSERLKSQPQRPSMSDLDENIDSDTPQDNTLTPESQKYKDVIRKTYGVEQWPTPAVAEVSEKLKQNKVTPDLVPNLTDEHLKEAGLALGERLRFAQKR